MTAGYGSHPRASVSEPITVTYSGDGEKAVLDQRAASAEITRIFTKNLDVDNGWSWKSTSDETKELWWGEFKVGRMIFAYIIVDIICVVSLLYLFITSTC